MNTLFSSKTWKSLAIATGGFLLTQVANILATTNFDVWTGIAVAASSVIIDLVRRYFTPVEPTNA